MLSLFYHITHLALSPFLVVLLLLLVGLGGDHLLAGLHIALLPVPLVPPELLLHTLAHPPLLQLCGNGPEILQAVHLAHPVPQVRVLAQPLVQHLEHVATDAGHLGPRVLLGQVQVLQGQGVQAVLLAAEQGGVLQQRLGTHDPIDPRFHETALHILIGVDAPIGDHRDLHVLLYLLDHLPVAGAHLVLVLLLGAPVDREQGAAGLDDPVHHLEGLLLGLADADFTEDGHFYVLDQGLHHIVDHIGLLQQVGTVMAPLGDGLGTTEIDINGINFILEHLGSLDHGLGVIATDLRDQGPVLGAGREVLLLVLLLRGHHLRVQHGRVAQVGPVLPGQHAEGQLRLFHHGGAHQQGKLEGQLVDHPLLVIIMLFSFIVGLIFLLIINRMHFRIRTSSLPSREKIQIRSLHQLLPSRTHVKVPQEQITQRIFSNTNLRILKSSSNGNVKGYGRRGEGKERSWQGETSTHNFQSRQSVQLEETRKRSTMPHFRYRSMDLEARKTTNSPMWTAIHYEYLSQNSKPAQQQKSPERDTKQQFLRKGSNINKRVVVNLLKLKLNKNSQEDHIQVDNTIRNNEILQMIKIYKGYGQAQSLTAMNVGRLERRLGQKENEGRDEIKSFPFRNLNIELSVSGWRNRKNAPNSPQESELEQKIQAM